MTTQIKYLAFKGIEKKEQILFKSFLNLAKNELEYKVVVLKAGHEDEPDILILDESYSFDDSEKGLATRPTILVGNDLDNDSDTYICRPVQWSDFKLALSQLTVNVVNADPPPLLRVLPSDIKFAINIHSENSFASHSQTTEQDFSNANEHKFDLENMSIDYNSFTSSEYVKVADDVRKFNQQNTDVSANQPVLLMTDDESSSVNSVLVIETDSNEIWDITLSEHTSISEVDQTVNDEIESEVEDDEVVLEQKVGLQMQSNEEYWLTDNEIIVDHQTLFYIKAERQMVYSMKEPGLWSQILRKGTISKLPMTSNWQPKNGFKAYPMSCLSWVNALINDIEDLAPGLDQNAGYILKKWPQFDLIELDNTLLKLCTMLFVRTETVDSLMTKSGYNRATVVGFINACNNVNILTAANDFDQKSSTSISSPVGVLGKIKDVFR